MDGVSIQHPATCDLLVYHQVLSARQYRLLLSYDHILKSVKNVWVKLDEKLLLKIDGDFNSHSATKARACWPGRGWRAGMVVKYLGISWQQRGGL